MWINENNQIVQEGVDYTDSYGTQFPKNFPRSEIPGLVWVEDDASETKRQFNEDIDNKILALEDTVTKRNLRDAFLGDTFALDKIRSVENAIVALRNLKMQ